MKAALHGVPSLSILDGWSIEGCFEGITGWAFADRLGPDDGEAYEADLLYHKLERVIVPMFYSNPDAYARVMRSAIAVNARSSIPTAWFRNIWRMRGFMKNERLDMHETGGHKYRAVLTANRMTAS